MNIKKQVRLGAWEKDINDKQTKKMHIQKNNTQNFVDKYHQNHKGGGVVSALVGELKITI